MAHHVVIVVASIVLWCTSVSGSDAPLLSFGPNLAAEDLKDEIYKIWDERKADLAKNVRVSLSEGNPFILYNIQAGTQNLLQYAAKTHDLVLLNQLSELYLIAYEYLVTTPAGYKAWLCSGPSCDAWKLGYRNVEVPLVSSQYLYVIAKMANIIAYIPVAERTIRMNELVEKYVPVVVEHYCRWIYDSQKATGSYCSHSDASPLSQYRVARRKLFFVNLVSGKKYDNAVTDGQMWIAAGSLELIGAHQKDSNLVFLEEKRKIELLQFVNLFGQLLKSRLTESNLIDFLKKPTKGFNFDLGMWDEHPEYAYTGYTGEAFPTEENKKVASKVGWDISHARRLVQVFDTYYQNRSVTGLSFPSEETIKGLANQLTYGTFNRDFTKPLFTNFMDGTNGWYRVNYENRANFGYGPYQQSKALLTGGYGFWAAYNSDLKKVMLSLYKMIVSNDPTVVNFRRVYYWQNEKVDPADLLMFLPSLLPLTEP